jgi:uncharacterized protein YlzI (FlbEa/FlbD family)
MKLVAIGSVVVNADNIEEIRKFPDGGYRIRMVSGNTYNVDKLPEEIKIDNPQEG